MTAQHLRVPLPKYDDRKRVYIDGACQGGIGGWAVVYQGPLGKATFISGAEADTTNNRMELRSAIEALRLHPVRIPLHVVSDSQYLIRGVCEWLDGWKCHKWIGYKGKVQNRDLWVEIDGLLTSRDLKWSWVKGHAGTRGNEAADEAASKAIRTYLSRR